jgi:hypothetical protein
LLASSNIINDLKERQDYLQSLLVNLIEKVYINGTDKQFSITYKE